MKYYQEFLIAVNIASLLDQDTRLKRFQLALKALDNANITYPKVENFTTKELLAVAQSLKERNL